MFRRALIGLTLLTLTLAACRSNPTPAPTPSPAPTLPPPTATPLPAGTPAWLRQAVLYQIFPRSFYDSDGDGVGDLNGVTQKLDYVRDLGATAIWLTPVFSATAPGGYQIADHFSLAPELGAPQDLAALVEQAHARDMRVLIDLAAGRTSSQHPFFKDAYRNPASHFSSWYVWENAAQTAYKTANNDKSIALLNMDNPVVRDYTLKMAQQWMDLDGDGDLTDGIDGFVDQPQFAPPEFWKALRQQVKAARPDFVLVGYAASETSEELAPYYDAQFDAMVDTPLYRALTGRPDKKNDGLLNGQGSPISATQQIERQAQLYPPSAQLVRLLNSDSTNRVASEVGDNEARARQAAALLLTLPGTPAIYYGEEIGMRSGLNPNISRDLYHREPMDWYAAESGPGMPTWFNPDDRNNRANDKISVEEQAGASSLLEFYRALIAQRRLHLALTLGAFKTAETQQCSACLAFWRWHDQETFLVILNLGKTQTATINFAAAPNRPYGAGQDVLRGGRLSVPSNGRYTLSIEEGGIRILYWGP